MTNLTPSSEPCWLSKHQLAEASALVAIGFSYIGNVSEHFDDDEIDFYKCGSWKSWKFCTVAGECFLDAVCQGALYSWNLEQHPDLPKPNFLKERVQEIKSALNSVFYSDSNSVYKQLNLFEEQ
jgi:hypothetical protein